MTGRPRASLSTSKPVTTSPSRLSLWSHRRVRHYPRIRKAKAVPWRTLRVDPAGVDTVQEVGQVDGIGGIRATAPEPDQHRAQIVPIGGELRTGASPIMGATVAITLLYPWPPCGAAGHLGIGARLLIRDKRGEQREFVALSLLGASQCGAFAGRILIGRHARPAAKPHHAASRSSSSTVTSTGSSGCGR